MRELIKIHEYEGRKAVSARQLHDTLEIDTKFTQWIQRMFEYGFEEAQDYFPVLGNRSDGKAGKGRTDFALTIDCAKEIAMLQRSDKGKQLRKYFIEVEKKYRDQQQKPMSIEEHLMANAKALYDQKQKVQQIESDVEQLKAKTTTRPSYFTIAGYATLHKIKVNVRTAAKLGGAASRICKQREYPIDKVPDPRFGEVNSYPEEVLDEVFEKESIV